LECLYDSYLKKLRSYQIMRAEAGPSEDTVSCENAIEDAISKLKDLCERLGRTLPDEVELELAAH
jgi:hypothetical protein